MCSGSSRNGKSYEIVIIKILVKLNIKNKVKEGGIVKNTLLFKLVIKYFSYLKAKLIILLLNIS